MTKAICSACGRKIGSINGDELTYYWRPRRRVRTARAGSPRPAPSSSWTVTAIDDDFKLLAGSGDVAMFCANPQCAIEYPMPAAVRQLQRAQFRGRASVKIRQVSPADVQR